MYRFLPVGLLLINVLWTSTAQPAHALSLRFCVNPDSTPDSPSLKHTQPENAEWEQGQKLAQIAIAFYQAGKPDQMQRVNQQIQTKFRYSAERMRILSALQMLIVGNQEAALSELSNLNLTEQDATAILIEILKLPEADRATWVLQAVDRLPDRMINVKFAWLLGVADSYPNRTESMKLLAKARSLLYEEWQLDKWVDLAETYRRAGDAQIARSLLESVIKIGLPQNKIAAVSRAYAMLNDFNAAQKLIQTMPAAQHSVQTMLASQNLMSVQPIPDAPDNVRAAIALQFSDRGDVARSNHFLKQIRDPGIKRDISSQIIQKLLKQNRKLVLPENASTVERKIAEMGRFPGLYALIKDWQSIQFQQNAVAWLIYRAAQANQTIISDRMLTQLRGSDLNSFIRAAQLLNQVGYQSKAQSLLIEAIELAKQKDSALIPSLAGLLAETGNFQQANRLLDEQLAQFEHNPKEVNLPKSISSPGDFSIFSEESSLSHFFKEQFFSLSSSQSKQLHKLNLEQILQSVPPLQKDVKAIAYGHFAKEYSRARNFAKANELLQKIPARYCKFRTSIYQELVAQATMAKDAEVALTAMAQIHPSEENQSFLRAQFLAIAQFYIEQNKGTEAIPLLEHLLKPL